MKSLAIVAFLLFGTILSINAVIYEKHCLIFEESYNFDESRYAGKWYEIRRLYDPNDVELEDCVQEQYTQAEDDKLNFDILRAVQEGPTGEVIYSTGTATPKVFRNSKVPQFIVRYNTTDPADPDTAMDIVQTDYLNYAIVYSCNPVNTTTVSEFAWIISREPVLKKHTADLINKFVDAHFNHPEHKWRTTEQSDKTCKPNTLPPSSAAIRTTLYSSLVQITVALLVAKILL
ncbi:AAEL009569-PA [Aedes aegypti]|uniref:AAEL009569-PA n=1 Tax=Aedes aegypti TaxID=7159 RepID=Q16VH8_AEDAE|nr:AAEL009569-PA [Aedes aegypti]